MFYPKNSQGGTPLDWKFNSGISRNSISSKECPLSSQIEGANHGLCGTCNKGRVQSIIKKCPLIHCLCRSRRRIF